MAGSLPLYIYVDGSCEENRDVTAATPADGVSASSQGTMGSDEGEERSFSKEAVWLSPTKMQRVISELKSAQTTQQS